MKKFLFLFVILVLSYSLFACEENDELDNNATHNQLIKYDAVSAPMTNGPIVMDSAKDSESNYYLLDLGYVKNVPLSSGIRAYYGGQTPVTIGIEKSDINEKSVSTALTKAVSQTVSDTKMGSASFEINQSIEYGLFVSGETSLGASYSREWGNTTENSFSTTDTYETVEAIAEEMTVVISETIGEHEEAVGYYKMSLMGTCDVFALVQTTTDNSELKSFSYYFNARDDITFVSNYSKDGLFAEGGDNKIDLPDNFYKSLPIPTKSVESSVEDTTKPQYNKISTVLLPQSCAHDNGFDLSKSGNAVDISRHNGFNIGLLNLYGCVQSNNKYLIGDKENFAIRYEVLQDTEDLPRVGTELTKVSNDNSTRVKGTNIDSQTGYGAYWVRITYADDSQTEYSKTDALKYANNGTIIDIVTVEDIDAEKTIKKIEFVLVYELYVGGPGVFGIWWHAYTDWRCEYTYDFIG